jgi:hypothetical protein
LNTNPRPTKPLVYLQTMNEVELHYFDASDDSKSSTSELGPILNSLGFSSSFATRTRMLGICLLIIK